MIRPIFKIFVAVIALLLPDIALAQADTAAGRFVLAIGAVQIQRGKTTLQARSGVQVRSGDTIRTAVRSNAQLWLSDGTMIAIREQSEFRLDSYRYEKGNNASKSSSISSIVKGGARMVTGAIGKSNPRNVKVATRVALIGIRGTGFDLVDCIDQCLDDGKQAQTGVYGSVFEGAIEVENENGTNSLLQGKVFYVASKLVAPILLDRQPSFLADPVNMMGSGESTAGVEPPDAPASIPPATAGGEAVRIERLNPAPPPPPEQADALAIPAKRFTGLNQGNQTSIDTNDPSVILSLMSAEYNPATSERNVKNLLSSVSLKLDAGNITRITYPRLPNFPGYAIAGYSARLVEGGSDSGVIAWGRWADGSMLIGAWSGSSATPVAINIEKNQGFHWLVGDVTRSMPTQGSYRFNLLGATTPTETRANASGGWSVTGGSFTADLTNARITGNMELFVTRSDGYGYLGVDIAGSIANGLQGRPSDLSLAATKLTGSIPLCTATCNGIGNLSFFGNAANQPASHAGITYDLNTGQGYFVQGIAIFGR